MKNLIILVSGFIFVSISQAMDPAKRPSLRRLASSPERSEALSLAKFVNEIGSELTLEQMIKLIELDIASKRTQKRPNSRALQIDHPEQ